MKAIDHNLRHPAKYDKPIEGKFLHLIKTIPWLKISKKHKTWNSWNPMVLKIQLIPFQMGLEFSGPTIWAVTFQLLLPIPAYPQKYRGCVCFTIIEPHPTGHRSQHLLCLSSFSCQPLNVRTIFGTRFGLLEDCWERHETNTNYFGNFRWLHNLHNP